MISAKEANKIANDKNHILSTEEILNTFISKHANAGEYSCVYDESINGKLPIRDWKGIKQWLEHMEYDVYVTYVSGLLSDDTVKYEISWKESL